MCIRDRNKGPNKRSEINEEKVHLSNKFISHDYIQEQINICLLYTSDAADERSSVDLGGRRIIKKKKHIHQKRCHNKQIKK